MRDLSFGALVRRENHRQHPFGFHSFPGHSVCIRLVIIDRGAGTDETVRVRLESVLRGTKIPDTNVDPRTIIDWWHEPAFETPLRQILQKHLWKFEESTTVILNGMGEVVPE